MSKKLRGIALILAATMIASVTFVGCSDKKQSTGTNTPTQVENAKYDGDTGFDIGEVEEFTVFMNQAMPAYDKWESPVAKKITEMTGVKLKLIFPTGDFQEALSLMLSGGDYPDMVQTQLDSLAKMVNAGAAVDLTDMIDKYGPNIKKFYGDFYKRLKYSTDPNGDQSIYTFGYGSKHQESVEGVYWNSAFWVQNDVLKEAGYPKLETLEDFEKVLVDYKKKHPKIDGKDTIGLTLVTADGWRYLISLTNPAYYSAGKPDNGEWYIDKEKGEVRFHYKEESDKNYFKWLNHLLDIGILDPESFTQSYDDYKAKISSGRVLGLIDGFWQFFDGSEALRNSKKFNRLYIPFGITQEKGQTFSGEWKDGGVGVGGIALTNNCKKPEKIVNFFNYLASEDSQILREWGIEGVNYTVDESGKRIRNPEDVKRDMKDANKFISETGVKLYRSGDWLLQGIGYTLEKDGQPLTSEDPEPQINKFSKAEKETLAKYGQREFTGMVPSAKDFEPRIEGSLGGFIPADDDLNTKFEKAKNLVLPSVTKAILGSPEDFDANWQKFMDDIDATGIADVEAAVTEEYKARLAAWK